MTPPNDKEVTWEHEEDVRARDPNLFDDPISEV